ncbi:MAG: hypothetical protein M0P77_00605 [Firmicutes bacterium]|nr:hypothetical protein [Bacillota bacterium]
MKKKILVIIAFVILFQGLFFIGEISWADTRNPKLIISGGKIPVLNGGEEARINIPIENIGAAAARNVQVIMQLDDDSPFEMEELNTTYTINRINARQSDNAVFKIKVSENAADKVYSIKLLYYYSNMSGTDIFEDSDTIKVKVQNSKNPPKLILSAVGYGDTPLVVGENNTVSMVIRNKGFLEAKDISISLKGLSTNGFTLYKSSNSKLLPDLEGNKVVQADYIIIPSLSMETGNYDLTLKIDYKDSSNSTYSEEVLFFLPVKGLDTNISDIVIENISVPDEEISVGKDFLIAFDIVNKGDIEVDDVKASLVLDKEIICKSLNINSIGKLAKGQSERIEFVLYATNESVTKNYPIQINIEFESGAGEKKIKNNLTQYSGVFVNKGSIGGTPRIIVDKYNIDPGIIRAGDVFQLTMSLLNTSASYAVSNIKVSLVSDDGVFNPVDSSNTIFIESIGAKENIQKVFTLMPKRDAEHKTYGISVNIDYEDEKGVQINSNDMISVPVVQQVKLVLGDLITPPEVFLGQPFPVSVEFFNMGKTLLYNLMIRTEGDFTTQNSNYYVGNFESGSTDSYDVGIVPEQEGMLKGNIVFSFENAVGELFEEIKEFEVNVVQMPMEPMPNPDFDDSMGNGGSGGKLSKYMKNPYVIVAIILLAAGVVIKVKKTQKKKKEMWLDE